MSAQPKPIKVGGQYGPIPPKVIIILEDLGLPANVIERYTKEVNRASGVLEGHLAKQKSADGGSTGGEGPWLVGNKLSYAIAFIPWQRLAGMMLEKDQYNEDDFPHVKEWMSNMTARESIKKALQITPPTE